MTETVGLAAGPRGYGGTKTATAQAIGSAIPGPRSGQYAAGQRSSMLGRSRGFSTESCGSVQGNLNSSSRLGYSHSPGTPSLSGGRYYTLSSGTGTSAPSGTSPAHTTTTTSPGTNAAPATSRLAKTRLPVSTAPESPSLPTPLLHRQPRSYLRTRASSSLASSIDAPADPRPLQAPASDSTSTVTAPVTARARRASDESALSADTAVSPPPGSAQASSPPSSIHAPTSTDDKLVSSAYISRRPHRTRSSSFDLPVGPRPRPRAYSDQGPRPDLSRPPSSFYLRRSSNPEPPVGRDSHLWSSPTSSHSSVFSRPSREPASFSSQGISTASGPPPSINGRLLHLADHQQPQPQHQPRFISGSRELLPLKTATRSQPPNEGRRRSPQHSYRLSLNGSLPANATPTRVPPIRSFRSSGSRKSLQLADMNFTPRPYDLDESAGAPLYDDDTARAPAGLDARYDRQSRLMTPPVSGRQGPNGPNGPNGDESGDVFLRLAREDAMNRTANGRTPDGTYSPVSATHRSWHRRPLSTNVASYHQPLSPPKLRRRLSDQQDRPYLANLEDDQAAQASRALQYRSLGRDKAASAHPGEASSQYAPPTRTHRPPPLSSRSPVYHENSDNYRHTRRRSSVTDSTPPISGRGQPHKTGAVYNYNKTYSPSPLVKSFDLPPPQTQEPQPVVEGTESTASTTAPSTVWDELDELKSRINRLEVTGKLPSTSGAAVTKMSEERPVTANTTITTASLSPKRQVHVHSDETASASTQRDPYPILHTALANCKLNLSPEVYQALDCVAQDALGLSAAMGHGPTSSGTSTIGAGSLATDRQMRRKAASVCQSLTELCITLNDDVVRQASASQQQAQAYAAEGHRGAPSTPTLPKSHSGGLPVSRRSSVVEGGLPLSHTSPRVMSRFEERRNSLMQGNAPPVSLHGNQNHTATGDNNLGRHSSLYVSRTRQSRQDDPEDGRESALSRSRRAMTEEPEDGRKSTYLVRSRRGTGEETEQPALSRSPTRRHATFQYAPANEHAIETDAPDRQDTSSVVSSATTRRRMASELHASRLAQPSGSSPAPTRKYLERSVSTREGSNTPTLDHHIARNFSLHHRAGSLHRPSNRDTMIPRPPSGNNASEGSP